MEHTVMTVSHGVLQGFRWNWICLKTKLARSIAVELMDIDHAWKMVCTSFGFAQGHLVLYWIKLDCLLIHLRNYCLL